MKTKESQTTKFKPSLSDGYLKLSHIRGQYEDGS